MTRARTSNWSWTGINATKIAFEVCRIRLMVGTVAMSVKYIVCVVAKVSVCTRGR